jgi:nucleoside-diphosphate-sugar epimerase
MIKPMSDQVLVTGASGFTGSHLANELARRGNRVRALVRNTSDTSGLDRQLVDAGDIEFVHGDLRNPRDVERAVAGVRFVYHVAALYRTARHSDAAYWDVNVRGTQSVLEAAKQHAVERVLHCSTIGVHGGVSEVPATEDSTFAPSDIYQITKLEGERLAQAAIASGQPVTVVRPAGIYGPGDLRFLKLFSMVKSGRFIMFGSGQTLLHLVYIDDLVRGMIQAVETPNAVGKTLILAGEQYVSLNELVSLVATATDCVAPRWRLPLWPLMTAATLCEWGCRPLGWEPPLHRRRAAFFTKNRAFSIDRARSEIGYTPRIDLSTGLKLTADWYQQHHLLT